MPKVTVTTTGFPELDRKLKKLKGTEGKKVVRKSARTALKPVLQESRSLAPSDTGFLKRNIKVRALPRSRKVFGARVTSGRGKNANSGDAFYGAFLEFGTRNIKPRRFMKQAADRKRTQALRIYQNELRKNIVMVAKSG